MKMKMIFGPNERNENLKGQKPMEVWVPPETNPFGLQRNTAGIWGLTRWSTGERPKRFLNKVHERIETFERMLGSRFRRKNFAGSSP